MSVGDTAEIERRLVDEPSGSRAGSPSMLAAFFDAFRQSATPELVERRVLEDERRGAGVDVRCLRAENKRRRAEERRGEKIRRRCSGHQREAKNRKETQKSQVLCIDEKSS